MKDYDIAIIGGGLLGSAFGWGLASRDQRTVVFDEGDNAIRTARGNFGLVWVQGKGVGMPEYAKWSLDSALEWTGFAERLERETGIDIHYERRGGFVICLNDEEMQSNVDQLETLRRESGERGYEFETLKYSELRKRIPIIGKVSGATYCPHDGHCNPLKLLRALHTGYLNRGGQYQPWTKITEINPRDGGGFLLSTAEGQSVASAEKIIVAAGHGSPELANRLGSTCLFFPIRVRSS